MVSELTIKTDFFKILNANSELKTLLNGGLIYKQSRPINSKENDIVINVNFLNDKYGTGVNFGEANINIYSKALNNGTCDSSFLESVSDKVYSIFESINWKRNGFYFNVAQTNVINELNKNDWFYFNFNLEVYNNNQS
jgi:hypothetical protein